MLYFPCTLSFIVHSRVFLFVRQLVSLSISLSLSLPFVPSSFFFLSLFALSPFFISLSLCSFFFTSFLFFPLCLMFYYLLLYNLVSHHYFRICVLLCLIIPFINECTYVYRMSHDERSIISVILNKKVYMYTCLIPNGFRDKATSLYSSKIVDRKEILCTVSNTDIYCSSDKVGTV
jgi:hypothetical protein